MTERYVGVFEYDGGMWDKEKQKHVDSSGFDIYIGNRNHFNSEYDVKKDEDLPGHVNSCVYMFPIDSKRENVNIANYFIELIGSNDSDPHVGILHLDFTNDSDEEIEKLRLKSRGEMGSHHLRYCSLDRVVLDKAISEAMPRLIHHSSNINPKLNLSA